MSVWLTILLLWLTATVFTLFGWFLCASFSRVADGECGKRG